MANPSIDQARERANSKFKKREETAAEGEKAMAEYTARRNAEHEKVMKLKSLRLAKEAADRVAAAAAAAKPVVKRRKVAKPAEAE